jgi:uncharacterized protein (DUF1778 family)
MTILTDRIELRVAPEIKRRLQVAADETGHTLSGFVLESALARADEIVPTHTLVPADYFAQLVAALNGPLEPMPRLAEAARRSPPFEIR